MSAPRTMPDALAPPLDAADPRAALRPVVAFLILLALLVGLTPFQDLSSTRMVEHATGQEVPTYALLAALDLAGLVLVAAAGRRALLSLLRTPTVLLGLWLALTSLVFSADPAASVRRLVLTLLTLGAAALVPLLARDLRQFRDLLLAAAASVLALSYAGLLLSPDLAIHQRTDILEPQLAGEWRGLYGHKNLAGGVMAVLALVGLFGAATGRGVLGGLVAAGALVFLLGSGGKSATGLITVAGLAAWGIGAVRSPALRAVIAFTPLVALNLLTVGSVALPAVGALVAALPVDATFTGRTDIWSFALAGVAEAPWTGHGFSAFWGSARTLFGAEDATVWAGEAATSHNAYLDLALTIGLPGLGLTLWAFVWAPLRNACAALGHPGNRGLARFLVAVWLFSLYLGAFEAYILTRAEPLWFLLALSLCGLRYAALRPVRP